MPRRRLAWFSALPITAAGSLAAHSLAYRIVEPDPQQRADVLAATGHAYLAYTPIALAGCLALLLAGLAGHAVHAFRGASSARPAWPVALVPLIAFTLQEHLERLVAWGHLPLAAALEPTFLVGLALQIPFALAALLVARLLAGAAQAVGRALASSTPAFARRTLDIPIGVEVFLPRHPALALGCAGRAPPA